VWVIRALACAGVLWSPAWVQEAYGAAHDAGVQAQDILVQGHLVEAHSVGAFFVFVAHRQ
jgi:hypothetical protein